METAAIRLRSGQVRNFRMVRDRDSLLWIANHGTVELHVFLGLARSLEQPTGVLFDLDTQPPAGFADAARVAAAAADRGPLEQVVASATRRDQRAGTVLIDWAQNNGRMMVAPYSMRASDLPTVSTPITWDELRQGGRRFGPDQVLDRLEQVGDLFEPTLRPFPLDEHRYFGGGRRSGL